MRSPMNLHCHFEFDNGSTVYEDFVLQIWILETKSVFVIPGIHSENAFDNFKVLIKKNVIATVVPNPGTYKWWTWFYLIK